ncbi:MAG: hypothetical protein IJX65_06875 [Alistipes sp.]|nr:hypothetical protein [Alistipes sp.]
MRTERFRFSGGVKLTSAVVSGVLVFVVVDMWSVGVVQGLVASAVAVAMVASVLLCMPWRLVVDAQEIRVVHPIGQTKILRSEIVEIRAIGREDIMGSLRVFGSGGYFGWYGIFESFKIGRYRMYSGDRESLYLVRTEQRSYVISSRNGLEI